MLNKLHQLDYSESYSEIQNYKCCYRNSRNNRGENGVSGTANDVLETTVEGTFDEDDDETEVDAALEDQLLAEINESGMSANNY